MLKHGDKIYHKYYRQYGIFIEYDTEDSLKCVITLNGSPDKKINVYIDDILIKDESIELDACKNCFGAANNDCSKCIKIK